MEGNGLFSVDSVGEKVKVRNKVRTAVLKFVLPQFVLRLLGPRVCALIAGVQFDQNPPTSLSWIVLSRPIFDKDIEALEQNTDLSFTRVTRYMRLQSSWTPDAMRIQTFYQGVVGRAAASARHRNAVFARTLISRVNRRRTVLGVISGNVDYWQDEGFKTICSELDLPFVALVKEHPLTAEATRALEELFETTGYRYKGTVALVAGEASKRVFLSKGVCSEEKMIVTGLPRIDAWSSSDTECEFQEKKSVTLLSFKTGYGAEHTFLEVLDEFVRVAGESRSHLRAPAFVIKAKDREDEEEIRRFVGPENKELIHIVTDISLTELFASSSFVVGWGSMSLVEACGAMKHLVIPNWGECANPATSVFSHETHAARFATFPASRTEFRRLLTDYIGSPPPAIPDGEAQEIMRQFVHLPVGQSISGLVESVLGKISSPAE